MSSFNILFNRALALTEARKSSLMAGNIGDLWSKTRSALDAQGVSSGNYEIIKFMWQLLNNDDLQPTGAILSDEEVKQIKKGTGPGGKRKLLVAAINAKKEQIDQVTNFQELIDKQMEFYVDREAINRGTGEQGRQELYQKQAEARAAAKEAAKELKQKVKQAKETQGEEAAAIINTAIDEIDNGLSTVFTDLQSSQELAAEDPTTILTIEFEEDVIGDQETLQAIQNYLSKFIKPEDIEGEMTVEAGLIDVSLLPTSKISQIAKRDPQKVESVIATELEKITGLVVIVSVILPNTYEPIDIAAAITPGSEDEETPEEEEKEDEETVTEEKTSYTNQYLTEQTVKDSHTHKSKENVVSNRQHMKPKTIHQAIELAKYGR